MAFGTSTSVSGAFQSFMINNLLYTDSYMTTKRNLISTEGLEHDVNFEILFNDINVRNVSFYTEGCFMHFSHQLPLPVELTNLVMSSTKSASICVESNNKQNTDLLSRVAISDSEFDSINCGYSSVINAYEGARVEVANSSFTNNYGFDSGAITEAGYQQAEVSFYDTIFTNNSALEGSLFVTESQSGVKCYNCSIYSNFAFIGGIAKVSNGGYIELYDSRIFNNFAYSIALVEILDSSITSVINNCEVYGNKAFLSEWKQEFEGRCDNLCFLKTEFVDYILGGAAYTVDSPSPTLFQVLFASISIQNLTTITNQTQIVDLFISSSSIQDCTISEAEVTSSSFRVTSSNLTMENVEMYNISNPSDIEFVFQTLDSSTTVKNCSFTNSSSNLLVSSDSNVFVDGLRLINIESVSPLISISDSLSITINNIEVEEASSSNGAMIYLSKSSDISISNLDAREINGTAVRIYNSNASLIEAVSVNESYQGLDIDNSRILQMIDCEFNDLGSSDHLYGGAINIYNSDVTITSSKFSRNIAMHGAALAFRCTSMKNCGLSLSGSTLTNNTALIEGGGVYYDYARPTFEENSFYENQAAFGPNIASYPVRIVRNGSLSNNIQIENVGSGIEYSDTLTLTLIDYDNQTMVLNNQDRIILNPVDFSSSSILGTNFALMSAGVASFRDLTFVNNPGAENVMFRASTSAIDSSKIKSVYGSLLSSNDVLVSFRF